LKTLTTAETALALAQSSARRDISIPDAQKIFCRERRA
jgi:hypothetical protein